MIRSVIIIFSAGYVISTLCYQYFWNRSLKDAYIYIILGMLPVLCSGRAATLITHERQGNERLRDAIKTLFTDKEADED